MIEAAFILSTLAAAPVVTEGEACPDMDLASRVGEYLGGAEPPEPVAATLGREGDLWRLSVSVGGAERVFRATSCATVIDAGAFLVAVAVDPSVADRPAPPQGDEADDDTVPEPPPEPEPQPQAEPEPEPEPGSVAAPAPEPGPTGDDRPAGDLDAEDPPPRRARKTVLIAGIELGLDGGSLPVVGLLARPWIGVGGARWRAAATGAFRARSLATADSDPTIGGEIGAWAVGGRGCGLPKLPRKRLALPLCGGVEGGQVIGRGVGFEGAADTAIAWLAVTAGPTVVYRPVAALGVSLGAEIGVAPLGGELLIEGLGTIHTVGPVFGRLLGGIEVRFGALSER